MSRLPGDRAYRPTGCTHVRSRDIIVGTVGCLAGRDPEGRGAQGPVTIFGTVTHASRSIVPGATITATNAQTALERVTVGRHLSNGWQLYDVSIERPGVERPLLPVPSRKTVRPFSWDGDVTGRTESCGAREPDEPIIPR